MLQGSDTFVVKYIVVVNVRSPRLSFSASWRRGSRDGGGVEQYWYLIFDWDVIGSGSF